MSNVASLAAQGKKKSPVNVRLGRNVRFIMSERGINQVQLALDLGLTESQVSRRLSGAVDWTPDDIEKAARLLRVGIERLFTLPLPDLDSNQEPAGIVTALPIRGSADESTQIGDLAIVTPIRSIAAS